MKKSTSDQATDNCIDELRDMIDLASKVDLFAGRLQVRGGEAIRKSLEEICGGVERGGGCHQQDQGGKKRCGRPWVHQA